MYSSSGSSAHGDAAHCGMCGACGSQPPWAPEALASLPPEEQAAVLARVEERRARFIAARDARDPPADAISLECTARRTCDSSIVDGESDATSSLPQTSTGSDLFLTPVGSPGQETEPKSEVEPEVVPKLKSKNEPKSDPEPDPKPNPDPDREPQLENEPEHEPVPKPEYDTEHETEAKPEQVAELDPEVEHPPDHETQSFPSRVTYLYDTVDLADLGADARGDSCKPECLPPVDLNEVAKPPRPDARSPDPPNVQHPSSSYESPDIVPQGQWPGDDEMEQKLRRDIIHEFADTTVEFSGLNLAGGMARCDMEVQPDKNDYGLDDESLEESVSSRRGRLSRRNDPASSLSHDSIPVLESTGFHSSPESPSQVEVSLRSPQFRVRSMPGSFRDCECDSLRKRVAELEIHVEALEGALEARAMATVSLRAKAIKGVSPKATAMARLREECDSLRLTVDFRTSIFSLHRNLLVLHRPL
jgi:hypothetical protein